MLRERHGEDLDQWLDTAFSSGIPEWRAFVRKLRQDQAAVQAGLVLKWNNGPVEGQINRLKLLKRSMYDIVGECLQQRPERLSYHFRGRLLEQAGSRSGRTNQGHPEPSPFPRLAQWLLAELHGSWHPRDARTL